MTNRLIRSISFVVLLSAIISIACRQATPPPSSAYVAPRTAAGKPDLQGIWQALNTASFDIQDHAAELGVPPGLGVVEGNDLPYQASALEQRKKNYERRMTDDPERQCYLPGVPRATYMPYPFQIVQTEQLVTFAYTYAHALRMAYFGRPQLAPGLDWWMGSSRASWDGDTLVLDVNNQNDMTWFDRSGNFHSDALHVVERYTRTSPDHIRYEATIEDPKVFTRPWKMQMTLYRIDDPDARILPYDCYVFEGPHVLTYQGPN